jgi:hypothetical protein
MLLCFDWLDKTCIGCIIQNYYYAINRDIQSHGEVTGAFLANDGKQTCPHVLSCWIPIMLYVCITCYCLGIKSYFKVTTYIDAFIPIIAANYYYALQFGFYCKLPVKEKNPRLICQHFSQSRPTFLYWWTGSEYAHLSTPYCLNGEHIWLLCF